MNKERTSRKIVRHHSRHANPKGSFPPPLWTGDREGGVSDELTTTRVMLSVALPRSSSGPGSACAFRTALRLPGGRWFPAIL